MLLKSILKWVLLGPLYLLSFFIRRKKNIWCVGGLGGKYIDNSKIMFEYISEETEVICVWITRSVEEKKNIENKGYRSEFRYSLRGIYYSLIASKYIYSCYIGDVNFWTSGRVIGINLWHGTPLKLIENDILIGPLARIFNPKSKFELINAWICYPSMKIGHDVVLYSSNYERNVYKKAFKANKMINALSPRSIVLLDKKNGSNVKKILFAPSWRSCSVVENNNYNNELIKKIDTYCKINNFELDISFHINSTLIVNNNIKYTDVSGVPIENRINDYILLITDFSSICFDFIVLNKPVMFVANDLIEYSKSDRGFYPEALDYLSKVILSDLCDFELSLSHALNNEELNNFIKRNNECISSMDELFLSIHEVVK